MQTKNIFRASQVILLAFGHFTVDLYAGFLPVMVPVLQQALGFSIAHAAVLISVFSLSTSLFQCFSGYVFDRWRDTRLMMMAPLVAGICMSCLGIASSFFGLILLLMIGGISIAFFHPQGAALVSFLSGPRHSIGMSIFVTGGTVGVATGSLLASVLVEAFGLSGPIYGIAFGGLMSYGLWWRMNHLVPTEMKSMMQLQEKNKGPGYGRLVVWVILAATKAFIILGCLTFVPFYIIHEGNSLHTVGVTLFVFGLAGGVGGLTGGSWAERIGERRVLIASFLLPAPLLSLYLLLGSSVTGIVCFGLTGYWLYSGVPILLSACQRNFPGRVGVTSSLVMGLSWGLAGLGISPAGIIAEKVGLGDALWGLVLIALVGVVLAYLILWMTFLDVALSGNKSKKGLVEEVFPTSHDEAASSGRNFLRIHFMASSSSPTFRRMQPRKKIQRPKRTEVRIPNRLHGKVCWGSLKISHW